MSTLFLKKKNVFVRLKCKVTEREKGGERREISSMYWLIPQTATRRTGPFPPHTSPKLGAWTLFQVCPRGCFPRQIESGTAQTGSGAHIGVPCCMHALTATAHTNPDVCLFLQEVSDCHLKFLP